MKLKCLSKPAKTAVKLAMTGKVQQRKFKKSENQAVFPVIRSTDADVFTSEELIPLVRATLSL